MTQTPLKLLGGLLISSILAFGGVAVAQDEGLDVNVSVTSATSPKEKLAFAKDALSEMDDATKEVAKLLDQAERIGDADMIKCVRLKQSSIVTLKQVSTAAQTRMSEAIAASNDARAEHEFRKVSVAITKVRQFLSEAEGCLGEAGDSEGNVQIGVENDGVSDGTETEPITGDLGSVGVDPPGISPLE